MAPRVHVAFSASAGRVDVDARAEFERESFMFEPSLDDRARRGEFWNQLEAPDVEHVLYTQTGDHALIGRFRKLVADGRLESEGDLSIGLRDTRVRRPPVR